MNPKTKFFELAKAVSKKSIHPMHKLGSVLVRKNRVISIGFNKPQTHSKSPDPFKYLHAEIHCILGVPSKELKGSIIYVYREKKNNGGPGLSKPCPYCAQVIKESGIKGVYYSTNEVPYWKYEKVS